MMGKLIDDYFTSHLSLSPADATHLHTHYYLTYGLAIEGLVRHHRVDPLEYNALVDDALPLEDVLSPDLELRRLLEDVDRSRVRLWLFTNAYVNHARRVVRLLGLDGGDGEGEGEGKLFEGLTYCDYGAATRVSEETGEMEGFSCKPHRKMFDKAMREAGVEEMGKCYFVGMCLRLLSSFAFNFLPRVICSPPFSSASFRPTCHSLLWTAKASHQTKLTDDHLDDSALNCRAAAALGWTAAHLVEPDDAPPKEKASQFQVRSLYQLREIWPHFFKSTNVSQA